MSRTAVPPARVSFASVIVWVLSLAMVVTVLAAVGPQAYDNIIARFSGAKPPAIVFPTPHAVFRDLSAPPPAASPAPPQAPLRVNSAPAIVAPVSAPTVAPVAPGITVIVVKPSSGAPIVVRGGKKYRSAP